MGSIAGQNIILLMLTAMEHDMQFRLSRKMDTSQMLSMRSIFLGNQKAQALQAYSQFGSKDKRYINARRALIEIEKRERTLQALEKQLELEMKQLENQLKIIQQRKENVQKMLDNNIKQGFGGGGR